MAIVFAPFPIPCVCDNKHEAYVIYVESSNWPENDVWTVCHLEGGQVRHYTTDQIKIYQNLTFGIVKQKTSETKPEPRQTTWKVSDQ